MLQQFNDLKVSYLARKERGRVKQIPALLYRISTLLEEGYTFSDSITILLPYHVEKADYWRNRIQEKLRNGSDVVDVLQCLSIPNQYLMTIKIAEENGEMASSLKSMAEQMEFNMNMQKKLTKLLFYPILLIFILATIFLSFRLFFLPNMEQVIRSRTATDTRGVILSNYLLHLPDFILLSLSVLLVISLLFITFVRRLDVKERLAILMRIPGINYFYRIQITRQFSNTLGSLLVSGFSLQQALTILQQQKLNQSLAFVSEKVEKQVIYGDSLAQSISFLPWFSPKFEDFIKHGEKSGYLGRELLIYCDLLDEKLQSIIKACLSIVQPLFFIIIAICIIAAYLSVLLPMYELIEII